MLRTLSCVLAVSLLVCPAMGEPRQWSDDFKTVVTYDSSSLYSTCRGGSIPKYTLFEGLLGDVYGQRAWSGDGSLRFTTRSATELAPTVGRKDFALIGYYGTGINCPGVPPNGQSTEYFTSPDVCVYGGITFHRWQITYPPSGDWDVRGADGKPGVANVDDDGNGLTDNWEETLAARPTTVKSGFGNKNGTGYQAGVDAAPGVAGVDDDGNGIVDDVGETGTTGSDDGDDTVRVMPWVVFKANVEDTTLFYLDFDAGDSANVFSLHETYNLVAYELETANEITSYKYYQPGIQYNWVICVAGHSCFGAQLWHNADLSNPVETLGPKLNTRHTGPADHLFGFGYDTWTDGGVTPNYLKRQIVFKGNTNFSDTFWVLSGSSATYYPSPSADLDADKDVDGFDFLTFSNCYNGSNKAPLAACANSRADLDRDGDVDGFDFLTFSNCYNGSNRKPLVACFPPNLTTCGS